MRRRAMPTAKMAVSPYLTFRTMLRDSAMFQRVSVATLLTYKHRRVLREGRSMRMAKTLERKAGRKDTERMLKLPRSFLGGECQ
mgnify:FL=1